MPKVVLVLGATGRTGKHFVKHALEQGFVVRAIVRDPTKLIADDRSNSNFQVVLGSFTDPEIVEKALSDGEVDFVVCMAGDPKEKEKFMIVFVKVLVDAMRKYSVKRFLYQAGAFSPKAGEGISWILWVLRSTVGYAMGLSVHLLDNDAVIEFLAKEADDIEWVVTRPGLIMDRPSQGTVIRAKYRASPVTFTDLALFNLTLVQDSEAVHSTDYPKYAAK